ENVIPVQSSISVVVEAQTIVEPAAFVRKLFKPIKQFRALLVTSMHTTPEEARVFSNILLLMATPIASSTLMPTWFVLLKVMLFPVMVTSNNQELRTEPAIEIAMLDAAPETENSQPVICTARHWATVGLIAVNKMPAVVYPSNEQFDMSKSC